MAMIEKLLIHIQNLGKHYMDQVYLWIAISVIIIIIPVLELKKKKKQEAAGLEFTLRCGGYRCSSLSTRLNWLNHKLENLVSRSSPTLAYDGEVNNMYLFFQSLFAKCL